MCKIESCTGKPYAREWCSRHYNRWLLHGDPLFTKHQGLSHTGLYACWQNMKTRCTNPNFHLAHPTYIGVKYCSEWETFVGFKNWNDSLPADEQYIEGLVLSRIGDVGGYCPENCRWITKSANCIERAVNHGQNVYSEEIVALAELNGICYQTFARRVSDGWSIERAATTPTRSSVR